MTILKQLTLILSLGFMALALSSCRTEGGDGDLTVTIRPNSVSALPVKTSSCKGSLSGTPGDLAAPSVSYSSVTLKWTDPSRTFTLIYMDMSFNSPALSAKMDFYLNDDELLALFNNDLTMAAMTDPANPPTKTSVAACAIRAGSIPLINQANTTYVTGMLKVVGYATDADGNSSTIQEQVPISFQWTGLQ
jgi:hypothetical protein